MTEKKHKDQNAECGILFIVMLSVAMLNVVMLSVAMLNVVAPLGPVS